MSHYAVLKTDKPQSEIVSLFVKHLIEKGWSFSLKYKGGDAVVKLKERRT